MKQCMITFRSVTPAQRGEGTLKRMGIDCTVQRTPKWMEEQGCGYCLKLSCGNVPAAVDLLREQKIPLRKIYRFTQGEKAEEMHL